MRLEFFTTLFDYGHWANERVLNRASELSNADYTAVRPGIGSIRSKLIHALGAEETWIARCQSISPKTMLSEEELPTVDVLRKRWNQQDKTTSAYLDSLSDVDLERQITYYTRRENAKFSHSLFYILAHLINHSTQTRSEAAFMLTELGQSPGDLDLSLFLREHVGA